MFVTTAAERNIDRSFDVVVVGGGTSGSVVATRLALAGADVCLVEAGSSDLDYPEVGDIRNWLNVLGSDLDFGIRLASPHEELAYSAGRLLGGSSSLNNVWAFETPECDLRRWVSEGMSSAAANELDSTRFLVRSALAARPVDVGHPASQAFLEASRQAGMSDSLWGFSELSAGAGWVRLAAKGVSRRSSATAYLHEMPSDRLTLALNTTVIEILFDSRGNAEGVLTTRGAIRAPQVVVCLGALHSPLLMMRSGIGPGSHLRSFGIPVRADRDSVGENLQDHPLTGVTWSGKRSEATDQSHGWETAVFSSGEVSDEELDACVLFSTVPAPFADSTSNRLSQNSVAYTMAMYLCRPKSRGRVRLRTADPSAPPIVNAPLLNDPERADLSSMVRGIELIRRIAAQPAFSEWLGTEVEPGERVIGPELATFIARNVSTMFHPTSTCRMGQDDDAVVDEDFRVRGIGGVRIVDASVLPSIPTVPPYLSCVMFAERCAELMIRDSRLDDSHV